MRLLSLLTPPLWSYASRFALLPLAEAMGTERADLVASALQTVTFGALCAGVLWVESKRITAQPVDLTRRDWQAIREQAIEQERDAARQYALTIRPGNLALGCANGKQTKVFYFPAGITLEHLTAFGDLIAAGQPPRYRSLKSVFKHETWEGFRDWLMIAELNKYAVMAEYTNKRDEWDVNRAGRKLAIMWRCAASPTPLLSVAKKCMIEGNKTINKQFIGVET